MREKQYDDWIPLKDIPLKEESFSRKNEIGEILIKRYRSRKRKQKYIRLTLQLVASFLILFIGSAAAYQLTERTLLSNADARNIELPDGSSVLLKPHSALSYNRMTWPFSRKMHLRGSGVFSIVPGASCSVETPELTVSVLGTVFEITEQGETTDVTCIEGHVKVQSKLVSKNLTANERIQVQEFGYSLTTETREHSPDKIPEIRFIYDSIPLSEVIEDISNHYKCRIITDSVQTNSLFSGVLPDNNLEETIMIISECFGFKYIIEGKRIYLSD